MRIGMRALWPMIAFAAACQQTPPPAYPAGTYPPGYATGVFGGSWVTQGGSMTLQEQDGAVTGTIQSGGLQGSVQGAVRGGQLDFLLSMSDGSSGRFVAYSDGNQLTINTGGPQPLVFVRSGGPPPQVGLASAAPQGYPPAPQPAPPPSQPPAAEVPAFTAGPATGAPIGDPARGWEVRTPAGWKHGTQQGALMLGSDREAGAIFVAFYDHVTFEQAMAALDGEIRKLGGTPAGTPRATKVKAGRALIAELTGVTDGTPLQGRAVGIASASGMLVVVGFTRPDAFQTLRKRVDAVAQSARFFAPAPASGHDAEGRGQVGLVAGCFRSSTGSGSVWVERTLYFDGAGRFSKHGFVAGQSTDASGRFTGTSATLESRGDGGTYAVTGKRVRLQWNDGTIASYDLVYDKGQLGALQSGNTWYLRCN